MILTTAITWAILATGVGIWAALGWRWQALRYDSCNRQRHWWIKRRCEMKIELDAARDECLAAIARGDHYASSWGRIMRKLRFAEKANLDLRTELIRRQTAEKEAA